MDVRRFAFIGLIVLTLLALAYVLVVSRQSEREVNGANGPTSMAPPIAPAPEASVKTTGDKTTGDYADDWQSKCGPITDAKAQGQCTEALDKAYGRQAGVAVPVPPASGK